MAIELNTANSQTLSGIRGALQVADVGLQLFPEGKLIFTYGPQGYNLSMGSFGGVVDFSSPICAKIQRVNLNGSSTTTVLNNAITAIRGAWNLTGLVANAGTQAPFVIQNQALSAAALNQFFTDLPNPAPASPMTIVVTGNPGAATCNTSIATAKGYTVTT